MRGQVKLARGIVSHDVQRSGVVEHGLGVLVEPVVAYLLLRRTAKTGLMVEALRKVHTTVGVLLISEVGFRHSGEALMELNTAS